MPFFLKEREHIRKNLTKKQSNKIIHVHTCPFSLEYLLLFNPSGIVVRASDCVTEGGKIDSRLCTVLPAFNRFRIDKLNTELA